MGFFGKIHERILRKFIFQGVDFVLMVAMPLFFMAFEEPRQISTFWCARHWKTEPAS